MIQVRIKGIEEIIAKISKLKIVQKHNDELLFNLETDTVPLAKALAPVKTGALRDSIDVAQAGPLSCVIFDGVPYGKYQEFGWVNPQTGKFTQNPFMIPALRATIPEIAKRMRSKIIWEVKK